MKKIKIALFTLIVAMTINSCKKDYPKDIPDWLKNKIKGLKKETRWHKGCIHDLCMYIDEYTDGTNTTYWFQPGGTPVGYKIYDYNGNEQCYFETITPNSCGSINNLQSYYFKRRVWEEDN